MIVWQDESYIYSPQQQQSYLQWPILYPLSGPLYTTATMWCTLHYYNKATTTTTIPKGWRVAVHLQLHHPPVTLRGGCAACLDVNACGGDGGGGRGRLLKQAVKGKRGDVMFHSDSIGYIRWLHLVSVILTMTAVAHAIDFSQSSSSSSTTDQHISSRFTFRPKQFSLALEQTPQLFSPLSDALFPRDLCVCTTMK